MRKQDQMTHDEYSVSMFPLFQQMLQAHFPGALPMGDYMLQTCRYLRKFGFRDENTLGLVAVCRDEIAEPFVDLVIKYWGKTFDCRSLGGFLLMGKSGIAAATAHAPIVDGVRRFVLFAMPHIAISKQGEIGTVYREGIHQASHSCGSLSTVVKELESGRINLETDLDDMEQCCVRHKILSAINYGDKLDQLSITHLACRIIGDDVERLLGAVDPSTYNYAVLTGILIHGPADTHWIYPQRCSLVGAHPPQEDDAVGALQ